MQEFELNLHSQQPVADCVLLGTEDVCQAQCDKGKTTGIILLQELLTKLGSICWSLSQRDCLRFTHSNILKNMQLHLSQSHEDCCVDHHPWTKSTRMISHAMDPWVSIWHATLLHIFLLAPPHIPNLRHREYSFPSKPIDPTARFLGQVSLHLIRGNGAPGASCSLRRHKQHAKTSGKRNK